MTNSSNKVMPAIQITNGSSKHVKNGAKMSSSQLAEVLFTNPSDLFSIPNGNSVNPTAFGLITAFSNTLNKNNNGKSSHNEEPSISFINHIASLTDNFLRPIDVLVPTFLSNASIASALQNVGIVSVCVQKDFYKMLSRKALQSCPFKALRSYGRDFLLETARNRSRTFGRDYNVVQILKGLSSMKSIIVVGEPGVGKTAILEGLAQRLLQGKLLEGLMDKSIVSLDMKSLIIGVKNNENILYKRLASILKEVESSNGKIILHIEDVNLIFCEEFSKNASVLLKSFIKKQRGQFVCTTTPEEYRKYFEGDDFNESHYEEVIIEEPSVEETTSILKGLKGSFEAFHGVRILDSTLETVVRLSHQFISDRRLPKKAIDLLDEACQKVNMQTEGKPQSTSDTRSEDILRSQSMNLNERRPREEEKLSKKHKHKRSLSFLPCISCFGAQDHTVDGYIAPEIRSEASEPDDPENLCAIPTIDPEHIIEVLSHCTGIPITGVGKEKTSELVSRLCKRVIGQDEICEKLEKAIRDSGLYLGSRGKPAGVFLFVGGSGVGKTELAKTLAQELFNNDKAFLAIDMSVYQSEHSISRLIGNASECEGELTEHARTKPDTVILLERMEMAHAVITNKLQSLFQNGILTDGQGRVVDFSNTLLIMTSNLGSKHFPNVALDPTSWDQTQHLIKHEVRSHFSTEFIDQLDEIMVFKPLSKDNLKQIVSHQISNLKTCLCQDGIDLYVTDAALDVISQKSHVLGCGARSISRWIEKNVVTRIVEIMLHGEHNEAVSTIYIETAQTDNELTYNVQKIRKSVSLD